jgi:hypothetical protein
MTSPQRSTASLIEELSRLTGAPDAASAIRHHARELVRQYVELFGEPERPISVDALASLRGIGRSEERPVHSEDAELVPDGSGGVTIRVNPDRPETRLRFSVGHEISHTFFPDYSTKTWCRTDSRHRNRDDPDQLLESLCDIGASELLFPLPWFAADAQTVVDANGLIQLARTYHASREATIRRYAETSVESIAAVFFVWKLKPTQKGTVGRQDQGNLFGVTPEEEINDALRLRIEYAVTSETFKAEGHFLPRDKSVSNEGPIYLAASAGCPAEGECDLDLGRASGVYRVWAIPLWTADDLLGANGENSVAAILRPISVNKPKRKKNNNGGDGLFV